MKQRVYLISPSPDFGAQTLNEDSAIGISRQFAINASASIATIAAYFPEDVELRLCEEIVEEIDYNDPAEFIAISVNVSQAPNAVRIAARFRALGKTVILGGAHVSLMPELFENHADCLVAGEFEPIADEFMADFTSGQLKPRYQGRKADLAQSRLPRWDLYPNNLALAGVVQTSRGCPFECNFCDVIQYLGRVQRHKPPENVLREVQALYDLGYRQINLSDDNFTVYRKRALELLAALAAWNGAEGREPVGFFTQMSIDVARHPELLAACSNAGLRSSFIGIETSNTEALTESRKRQNLRVDLIEQCERVYRSGVTATAGLMVGFDSDDLSCFERQLEFSMALPVIIFRVSVLMAPAATPLYDQMKAAGRVIDEPSLQAQTVGNLVTNILPAQMTREELAEGASWLRAELIRPENAIRRFERCADLLADRPPHLVKPTNRRSSREASPYIELLGWAMSSVGLRRVVECVNDLAKDRPLIRDDLMEGLLLFINLCNRQSTGGEIAENPNRIRQLACVE